MRSIKQKVVAIDVESSSIPILLLHVELKLTEQVSQASILLNSNSYLAFAGLRSESRSVTSILSMAAHGVGSSVWMMFHSISVVLPSAMVGASCKRRAEVKFFSVYSLNEVLNRA